jgi:peptide/nickel transport system substrate-binding protein
MRQLIRWSAALGASAILATSLAACGGGDGAQGGSLGQPKKGGTLTILTNEDQFAHLDPQRNYAGEDFAFETAYLTRTLTAYQTSADPKQANQLVGDLATDTGKVTDGGRTWAFTLRSGAAWQDGSPVTCADIKYGVSRSFAQTVITDGPTYAVSMLDIPTVQDGTSAYKGPYVKSGNDVAAFDKAVQCSPDGSTITFHLNRPAADFNYTVSLPAFAPVPQAHDSGEDYDKSVFSDGPYQIADYTKGQQLKLVRNPHWDAAGDPNRPAYPDQVVVNFSQDSSVIDQRLIADAGNDKAAISRDVLGPEHLTQVFNDGRFSKRRINAQNPYVFLLAINTSTITNVKQRQAIMVALDRQQILTVDGGSFAGDIADGVVSPTIGDDYAESGLWTTMFGKKVPPTGDPELAKKLIAESGEPMPTITYDYGTTPQYDKEAAAVQSSLARAGIKVKLNPVPQAQRNAYELNPQTEGDLEWTAWATDWPNASTVLPELFGSGGGWPMARVGDTKFDTDVTAARSELDATKQATMWRDLNKYAMQNAWALPVRFGRDQRLAGSAVGAAHGPDHQVYLSPSYGAWPYADLYVTN